MTREEMNNLYDQFAMKSTKDNKNIKDLIDELVRPLSWEKTAYYDNEDIQHTVLSIKFEWSDGTTSTTDIYRTEVKAFIEKFGYYVEVFGELPPAEHPRIKITGKKSQRGNKYISFELEPRE